MVARVPLEPPKHDRSPVDTAAGVEAVVTPPRSGSADRGPQAGRSLSSAAPPVMGGDSTPLAELLHARAPHAVWRHVWRSVVRVLVLVCADVITLEVLRIVLVAARDHAWFGPALARALGSIVPQGAVPAVPLQFAVLLGLLLTGSYVGGARRRDIRGVALGAALGVLFVTWRDLFAPLDATRLLGVALLTASVAATLGVVRLVLDVLVERVRPRAAFALRAILVAPSRDLTAARTDPAFSDPTEFRFVGEVDTTRHEADSGTLGATTAMMRLIDEQRADTVVLYGHLPHPSGERLARVADAAGCNVVCLPRTLALHDFEPQLVFHHGAPLVRLVRAGERGRQLVVKRAMDIVISTFMLVLLSPLFVLVAIAVRATSRGPALFQQTRIGQGGRPFRMWKFRSMIADAEEQQEALAEQNVYGTEPLFKLERDPRITPLGRVLRRTSLDELPQFWNVLRGEMSLVGPRPPLPREVARYAEPHLTRLDVRPGLTGPWQVSGRNRVVRFEDVLALERAYIERWSFGTDVGILLRTVPAVLRMDGAQ
jgi:exopolysaccharide biosynthesis polyprenyl glycosylphosphotransferase